MYWILNGSFAEADAMDAAQFLADILRKQGNISNTSKAGVSLPNTLVQTKKLAFKHKTVFYFYRRTLFLYASSIISNSLLSFIRRSLFSNLAVSLIK